MCGLMCKELKDFMKAMFCSNTNYFVCKTLPMTAITALSCIKIPLP